MAGMNSRRHENKFFLPSWPACLLALAALAVLAGCTGKGHGAAYRPPVKGLDGQPQYERDLAECQDREKPLARSGEAGVQGAAIGGVAGAAITTPGATVGYGMLLGGLKAATDAEAQTRARIRGCLTWKGHEMTIR